MLVDDCSGWYNKYRPCLAVQLWDLHLEEITMTEKGNCMYSNNVALVIKLDGRQAMRSEEDSQNTKMVYLYRNCY